MTEPNVLKSKAELLYNNLYNILLFFQFLKYNFYGYLGIRVRLYPYLLYSYIHPLANCRVTRDHYKKNMLYRDIFLIL